MNPPEPQWISGLPNTVLVAAIAFAGACIAAAILYRSTMLVARRSLFVANVTAERASWRQDLRVAVGDLVESTRLAIKAPSDARIAEFHKHRVAVRLRLNPSLQEKHILDRLIRRSLKDLARAVERREQVPAEAALENIEANVQRLLKQEWDKSKDEAKAGEMVDAPQELQKPSTAC